ncbi:hypothetical protein MLD38_033973 [Melastoma candidum]|uniref:Uncharacterized protein n=1 Tax=Melastoma candidum TaxID=119954 RepID=A0ACB9M913_9MYRT|nr:hypothetical protein MLD38_033973 [Melastoma candidum]
MYAHYRHGRDVVRVLKRLPELNLATSTAMIMGYAKNGHTLEALELVNRLSQEDVRMDDHVVSIVLSACGDGYRENEEIDIALTE